MDSTTAAREAAKLLDPCPKCKTPNIWQPQGEVWICDIPHNLWPEIRCDYCGLRLRICDDSEGGMFPTLVKAWNKRAP